MCVNLHAHTAVDVSDAQTAVDAGDYTHLTNQLGQKKKKKCYIGVTRPTLKLGLTLHFF